MARGPIEQALSQRKMMQEAIQAGVGAPSATRYEPAGRTTDRSLLSFMAAGEADPVRGERYAPLLRRIVGTALDVVAVAVIWFLGFTGTAAMAVPFYTVLPENAPDYLAPVLIAFVASIPFWTLWVFNAQGWSPAGKVTDLRAVNEFGGAPGARAGLIRTLALVPAILPLGLGFWAAGWHHEGQSWQDRIAGTRIIQLLR
jgi:uncharacterized RDD family membrane protein YckC